MAPLTLADYAKLALADNDMLKLGVVQSFRQSVVLDKMNFHDSSALKVNFIRQKSLPSPAFRKIGNSYSTSKGDFRPGEEALYALGTNIEVDKVLIKSKNFITDPRTAHRELALEAMKRTFHNYFIRGDPETDEDGITGLHYRLKNKLPSVQSIDGKQLDISVSPITTTLVDKTIDLLENLIDACMEGEGEMVLLMDRKTRLQLNAIFRKSNLLATTKDQLGRKFTTYGEGGPMLVPMGNHRDETDETPGTKIIGHDEHGDGSALSSGDGCTSIYCVQFGKDKFDGAQLYPMDVTDKGELDDGVTYRDVIDWPMGIYQPHLRAVSRIYGLITDATPAS